MNSILAGEQIVNGRPVLQELGRFGEESSLPQCWQGACERLNLTPEEAMAAFPRLHVLTPAEATEKAIAELRARFED